MQLVTDRAADISQEQLDALAIDIHYVPLTLSLDGKDYISGVDIQPEEFYKLLDNTNSMPTTSQPSPVDVEALYRQIAETTGDNEILSVHVSHGLSGTANAVRLGAEQVAKDGINVHIIDTRTIAAAEGWQVEAAARAIMAGWTIEQIKDLLAEISKATNCVFTLPILKYLIHGGRIGHMKGLIASTLGIKPLIGVNYETGKYEQRGQVRTFKKAVVSIADSIAKFHEPGTKLRIQSEHTLNPEAVELMNEAISKKFEVEFMPTVSMATVLGAHTGAGMVGCIFAPADTFSKVP